METLPPILNTSFQTVGLQTMNMDTVIADSNPNEPSEQQQPPPQQQQQQPQQQQQQQQQEQQQMLVQPAKLTMRTKRPQLSCNPCRQRKVKCDRVSPCGACSMHQVADRCHYDLSEAERQPIIQAEALKEKDKAIARLQKELDSLRAYPIKTEPYDELLAYPSASQKMRLPPKSSTKSFGLGRKRSHSSALLDAIYFGSTGMTNVIEQFAHLSVERNPSSLTHPVPRGADIVTYQMATSHPFPTLWSAKDETEGLVKLLPSNAEIYVYLASFQRRAQSCSFPHVPDECTEAGIQRFLSNVEHNAAVNPNMLALLFTTLAQGLQDGVYDRNGEKWVAGSVGVESQKGDVYIAAAMQALRLASFMNRPTLVTIQALVMMGPYLTNCGKFLDASAIFGITVRLAQSIGLHRDPSQLSPPPPPKEMAIRKNIWWWMLHMDQHYSMALGRPLAISSIGDCPAPDPMSTEPLAQSISNHIPRFTILARQILSAEYLGNEQIDSFSHELLALKQTLPEAVNFNETWLNKEKTVPGWPLDIQAGMLHAKIHNLLILLNRQRLDDTRRDSKAESSMNPPNTTANSEPDHEIRGRERVLESCRALLQAFEFFQTRLRAAMICWSMGQMAFNAAMILTLSILETKETRDLGAVQHAYTAFIEMNKLGIHKLAGDGVARLGALLKGLLSSDAIKETVMGRQGMMLLEDPGLQGLVSDEMPPSDFPMADGAVRHDERRRRARTGLPMSPLAKSALGQRRRAHRSLSLRDTRPKILAKKPSMRSPHSPTHRTLSHSPKKEGDQESFIMDSSGDIAVVTTVAPEPELCFSQISPTQAEHNPHCQPDHNSQGMFTPVTDQSYQPFQVINFDPPTMSPTHEFSFDTPHPNTLTQQPQPLPFPPQNTPVDTENQAIMFPSHIDTTNLLDGAAFFHHDPQQQTPMDYNTFDNVPCSVKFIQYENPRFDLSQIPQIPVSYPPQF